MSSDVFAVIEGNQETDVLTTCRDRLRPVTTLAAASFTDREASSSLLYVQVVVTPPPRVITGWEGSLQANT